MRHKILTDTVVTITEVISSEEYEQFAQIKLQNLKSILTESIAQADRGELHDIEDVFSPLTDAAPSSHAW